MPFLRVVRDKRGYETTYLIHSFKEGPNPGSRVLYAFRSPGGVRVGRNPFEPSIRREIEQGHPDVAFDWDALVSGQQLIDSTPDPRRQRRRPGAPSEPRPGGAPHVESHQAPPRRAEPPPQTPKLTVPTIIEGETPEARMRFLAHWHGILCEQLPQRIPDPDRRQALLTLAQRLNPAGWIDADEIAAGLQSAVEALEQLSRGLSKRRRKARRGGQRDGASDPRGPRPLVVEAADDSTEVEDSALEVPADEQATDSDTAERPVSDDPESA